MEENCITMDRTTFSKTRFLFIFLRWLYNRRGCSLAVNPPWCRSERPSEGRCSPERRRRSGYPDSWRDGAASWGTNSRPEPQRTAAAGRRLTAGTQWCPPSTPDGLKTERGHVRQLQTTKRLRIYIQVSNICYLKGFEIKSQTAINSSNWIFKSFILHSTRTKVHLFIIENMMVAKDDHG